MSKGGKGGGKQTTTESLDPATQAYQQEIYRRAQAAANQPYTPYQGQQTAGASDLSTGAAGQFQHASGLGTLGVDALGGDASAFSKFMNPYQQNVIDALGQSYDRQRSQAALGANDAATQAGASGGDRNALLTGERQGALDRAQMSDTANLLYGGFNDAQGRAAQAANLGLGAAGQSADMGNYFRNIQQQQLDAAHANFNEARGWDDNRLGVFAGAGQGAPHGMTQTVPTQGGGLLGGLLGSALTLGGTLLGGPIGGAIGGSLGNSVQGGGGSGAMYGQTPGTSYYG